MNLFRQPFPGTVLLMCAVLVMGSVDSTSDDSHVWSLGWGYLDLPDNSCTLAMSTWLSHVHLIYFNQSLQNKPEIFGFIND